jgi:hypothetical protein
VSDDLAGWLLEQLAEDERTVQAALKRTRNWKQIDRPWRRVKNGAPEYRAVLAPEETLLAVWDPDRLLAECDAKRRIIAEIVPRMNSEEDWGHSMAGVGEQPPYEDSVALLRLLALPYADCPGYREEWRP